MKTNCNFSQNIGARKPMNL